MQSSRGEKMQSAHVGALPGIWWGREERGQVAVKVVLELKNHVFFNWEIGEHI